MGDNCMEKRIQIGKKTYTLTANRKIIKTIYNICPELLEIVNGDAPKTEDEKKQVEKKGVPISVSLIANLDDLFFDMIRIAHPEISKEKSDEILDDFMEEYDGVTEKLLELAMSVFTQGSQDSQKAKKKIDW